MNQNKPAAPLSDDKLRALLHDRLPQAPRNPWFVRKVMNRLPAKDSPAYSRIEYITYIIAIIAVIAGWWYVIADIHRAGVLTGGDVINMLCLGIVSTVIAVSFLAPRVRRWLSEA